MAAATAAIANFFIAPAPGNSAGSHVGDNFLLG
jgi:hypothetical protein